MNTYDLSSHFQEPVHAGVPMTFDHWYRTVYSRQHANQFVNDQPHHEGNRHRGHHRSQSDMVQEAGQEITVVQFETAKESAMEAFGVEKEKLIESARSMGANREENHRLYSEIDLAEGNLGRITNTITQFPKNIPQTLKLFESVSGPNNTVFVGESDAAHRLQKTYVEAFKDSIVEQHPVIKAWMKYQEEQNLLKKPTSDVSLTY